MLRAAPVAILVAGGVALGGLAAARAESESCRVLELDFTPTAGLQLVAWLEDSQGKFVDTLYITQATGRFGLGNRPGIMEFNSEFEWPYGRRESVFPVWAHKRGVTYPKIVFQDGLDRDLSHAFSKSSTEAHYCRPLKTDEQVRQKSIDIGSCATVAFTDKGKFSTASGDAKLSLYPPRRDVTYDPVADHVDVQMFASLNDLDAVSRATPVGGEPFTYSVAIPGTVPDGEYTIYVEASKEFDQNVSYRYASPALQAYGEYGQAYRGQPSVVWKVPIILDAVARRAQVSDYAGYGDPDGLDGRLRSPDTTITSNVDGSGASRLGLVAGENGMYRLAVSSLPSDTGQPPNAPTPMNVVVVEADLARISFVEPADPASGGAVKAFEVRIGKGQPLTPDNVATTGTVLATKIAPAGPGTLQMVDIPNLDQETHYWIAIRAQDDCLNSGAAAIVELVTPRAELPEVSACFVATAAWGSPMQAEVGILRQFRDRMLRRVALGELFVESYYTFGPALAGVIRPSPTLRQVTRAGLSPLVEWVRGLGL